MRRGSRAEKGTAPSGATALPEGRSGKRRLSPFRPGRRNVENLAAAQLQHAGRQERELLLLVRDEAERVSAGCNSTSSPTSHSVPAVSRWVNGSSNSNSGGSWTSARAMSSRCRIPRESRVGRASACGTSPVASSQRSARRRGWSARLIRAAKTRFSRSVRCGYRPLSCANRPIRAAHRHVAAGELAEPAHFAAVGPEHRRQTAQQGRLAGPVGAGHRHGLAARDLQVHGVEHGPAAEGLRQLAGSDCRLGFDHSSLPCSAYHAAVVGYASA